MPSCPVAHGTQSFYPTAMKAIGPGQAPPVKQPPPAKRPPPVPAKGPPPTQQPRPHIAQTAQQPPKPPAAPKAKPPPPVLGVNLPPAAPAKAPPLLKGQPLAAPQATETDIIAVMETFIKHKGADTRWMEVLAQHSTLTQRGMGAPPTQGAWDWRSESHTLGAMFKQHSTCPTHSAQGMAKEWWA